MGEIQLCRQYTVEVLVGLYIQVSNGSFPRFHLRNISYWAHCYNVALAKSNGPSRGRSSGFQ